MAGQEPHLATLLKDVRANLRKLAQGELTTAPEGPSGTGIFMPSRISGFCLGPPPIQLKTMGLTPEVAKLVKLFGR